MQYLKKIINDSIASLSNPEEYFSQLSENYRLLNPIIKTILYCIIFLTLNFSVLIISMSFNMDIFLSTRNVAISVLLIVYMFAFSFAFLFAGGLAVLLISAICRGKTDYRLCLNVSASIYILIIPYILLQYISRLHIQILIIFYNIILLAFGAWMLYNALIAAHRAEKNRAQIASAVLAVIAIAAAIFN